MGQSFFFWMVGIEEEAAGIVSEIYNKENTNVIIFQIVATLYTRSYEFLIINNRVRNQPLQVLVAETWISPQMRLKI